jgi:outer membrane protein W
MRARMILLITAGVIGVVSIPGSAAAQFGVNSKYFGIHLGVSDIGSAAAIGVNGEVAYNDRVGIGAWADTWSYGERMNFGGSSYDWNVRYVALAATGAYHFPVRSNRKLDPFAGAGLGYYVVSTTGNGFNGPTYNGSVSRMFLSIFGGARYALSNSASGVVRVGFGSAWITLGVDFKM